MTRVESLSGDCRQQHGQAAQSVEPPRLVEARLEEEAQSGARVVPASVVVGANDAKPILAGREIRIVRNPARACVYPIPIVALEHVFELHSWGNQKAQARVMKLDAVPDSRDFQRLRAEKRFPVCTGFLP